MRTPNLKEILTALKHELDSLTEYEIHEAAIEAFGYSKVSDTIEWMADILNMTAETAREVERDGDTARIVAPKVIESWIHPETGARCMVVELLDETRVEVTKDELNGIWRFSGRELLSVEDAGNLDDACGKAWALASPKAGQELI